MHVNQTCDAYAGLTVEDSFIAKMNSAALIQEVTAAKDPTESSRQEERIVKATKKLNSLKVLHQILLCFVEEVPMRTSTALILSKSTSRLH